MPLTAPIPVINAKPDNSVPEPKATARQRWLALAVLMLPVLLVSIDNTVLSFAVPKIAQALEPTGVQQLWIIDAYSLVLAGLLVPMGSTGDRIGRKKLLMIGATGFTLVSVAAAFAPSAEWLIAARAVLGFFGAMLMPSTLSLIRNIFSNPNERRKALAIWAAGFSSGSVLGPVIGGFLLEHFDWGSIFLMAVPILVPFLALAPFLLPESKDPNPGPVDVLSIVTIMIAMTSITYAIKHVAESGIDTVFVATLLIGLVLGWLFIRRQLHREIPMLDVRLFSNRVFTGAIASNLLAMMSMIGFIYFVSQHLQLVKGMSAMEAGLFLLPGAVLNMLAGLLVVRFVPRFHPGHLVAFGLLLNATGYAVVLVAGGESNVTLMVAFLILGMAAGIAETLANDLILSAVPAQKAGAASAISETSYEVGSVLGTAVLGGILTAAYRAHIELPAGLSESQAHTAEETLGGATQVAGEVSGDLGSQLVVAAQHAFDSGVMWTAAISVVMMLGATVMAYLTLRHANPNVGEVEH